MPKEPHTQRIARAFGLAQVASTVVGISPGLAMTLVELDLPCGGGESLPMRADDAFLLMHFTLAQDDLRFHSANEAWQATGILENEGCLLDLRVPFSLSWSHPLRAMALYVPRHAFFGGSEPGAGQRTLRCDRRINDTVLASIFECLGGAAFGRHTRNRDLFVRHMLLAACARLVQLRAVEVDRRNVPRTLTREQQQHAISIMRDRIESGISIREVAGACGVAHGGFVRAFKRSFGVSPRDWLMARRLDRAVELMGDHSMPLTQIATKVGFADSSQFNRIFTRFVGRPPGEWRRESFGIKALVLDRGYPAVPR